MWQNSGRSNHACRALDTQTKISISKSIDRDIKMLQMSSNREASNMPVSDHTLLQTKLHRARVTPDLVIRPRLFERLNRGLAGGLILVSAAAGYGKSTLVSSWIENLARGERHENDPLPAMWLSLDESDSDLSLFVRYFIAALQTHFPRIGIETLERV
jgi:ATP/maltotriose-dependent transcriptional regulator MalT